MWFLFIVFYCTVEQYQTHWLGSHGQNVRTCAHKHTLGWCHLSILCVYMCGYCQCLIWHPYAKNRYQLI